MNNAMIHPQGEPEPTALVPVSGPVAVEPFGGRVHVEWDAQAAVTPLGQLRSSSSFCRSAGGLTPGWRAVRWC